MHTNNDSWRFSAIAVTKYNPDFRDKEGRYIKNDWTSYTDAGIIYEGELFTLEKYFETEQKYIAAAQMFFLYNNCQTILITSVEKYDLEDYPFSDQSEAILAYNNTTSNGIISLQNLGIIIKLVLRGYLWCELFCAQSKEVALRFGYDLYMYINSPLQMDKLLKDIEHTGLFIGR